MAITLDDIKRMSPQMKALCLFLFYVLFSYFYYFYFIQGDLEKRSNLETKVKEQEQQISEKQRLVETASKYAKDVESLKATFKTALTKLPVRKEIPELLDSVALSGRNSGIEFLTFEPQATVKRPISGKSKPDKKESKGSQPAGQPAGKPPEEEDYYEEIPVKVAVEGRYHSLGVFFEKVARLPRIINMEDIYIGDAKSVKEGEPLLKVSFMLKTYMFVQKTKEKGTEADGKAK